MQKYFVVLVLAKIFFSPSTVAKEKKAGKLLHLNEPAMLFSIIPRFLSDVLFDES